MKTEQALLDNILMFGFILFRKTGDESLDDLIKKLLTNDPKKRITWEEYFNHPFFENYNPKKQQPKKMIIKKIYRFIRN